MSALAGGGETDGPLSSAGEALENPAGAPEPPPPSHIRPAAPVRPRAKERPSTPANARTQATPRPEGDPRVRACGAHSSEHDTADNKAVLYGLARSSGMSSR